MTTFDTFDCKTDTPFSNGHRIIAGQYIQAGKQGSRSEGQVLAPTNLEKNPETVKSSAFALPHRRPGTVSLCLGVNDDEEDRKLSEDYRNVEFLITTGALLQLLYDASCARAPRGSRVLFRLISEPNT